MSAVVQALQRSSVPALRGANARAELPWEPVARDGLPPGGAPWQTQAGWVQWHDHSSIVDSGGTISQWQNLAGGPHLTPQTAAAPTVVTLGGQRAVDFDGTTQALASAAAAGGLSGVSAWTVLMVLDDGLGSNGARIAALGPTGAAAAGGFEVVRNTSAQLLVRSRGTVGQSAWTATLNSALSLYHFVFTFGTPDTLAVYRNGAAISASGSAVNNGASTLSNSTLFVAAQNLVSNFLQADLGLLGVRAAASNAAECAADYAWAQSVWSGL